ncbi:hypothetical protein [Brevundimonas naejangsanensis]|uniref:hypothetical protein n=1 Tax=Brevundimonas naejangsanensis TaxID=588932 RepID=UPI0013C4BD78|nr:hypothetical protein [Brevundimonas naejangsanensis]
MRDDLREMNGWLSNSAQFFREFKSGSKQSFLEMGEIEGRGFSLLELTLEATRTVRSLRNVRSNRFSNLPSSIINSLVASTTALHVSVKALDTACHALVDENRSYRLESNGRVVTLLSREEMYNFGQLAESIFANLETLRAAGAALPIASTDSVSEEYLEESVAEIARRAAAQLAEAQEATNAALVANENAQARLGEFERLATTLTETGNSLAEESRQRATEVSSLRDAVSSSLENIQGHEEQISNHRNHVSDLANEAETDRSKLAEFASELSETRAEILQISKRADEDKSKQDEYLVQAEALIKRAEEMVSGATVAGLAKAFDDERRDLQRGMDSAMKWFFVGIVCLFLVTFLLAAYVFEIPFTVFGVELSGSGSTKAVGDEVTVAGVLSRTIILLAPFWMTLFSARRYRNLFDLRQQYSHKYNLAFSIDGFRKQAPAYGEELAAWVFHEISQRPVTTNNTKKMGDNPVPTLEMLVSGVVERTNFFRPKSPTAE